MDNKPQCQPHPEDYAGDGGAHVGGNFASQNG